MLASTMQFSTNDQPTTPTPHHTKGARAVPGRNNHHHRVLVFSKPNRVPVSHTTPPRKPPTTPRAGGLLVRLTTRRMALLRKEVIQPHLPVRLPCYDFVPIASPTFDGSL